MNGDHVVTSVKRFIITAECPAEWRAFDLYLFRDEEVTFYVGQSQLAYGRVWQHVRDGFKGRSLVGRFILCNWPASMKLTIELTSSRSSRFDHVGNDLNAAERLLIEQYSPCFNEALNGHPTPLPERYAPPTAAPTCPRRLSKMIREAEHAVQADNKKTWLA